DGRAGVAVDATEQQYAFAELRQRSRAVEILPDLESTGESHNIEPAAVRSPFDGSRRIQSPAPPGQLQYAAVEGQRVACGGTQIAVLTDRQHAAVQVRSTRIGVHATENQRAATILAKTVCAGQRAVDRRSDSAIDIDRGRVAARPDQFDIAADQTIAI